MAELNTHLREFIDLLHSKKVEYVVVGAHALAFHGRPRFTGDIDFLVNSTEENATRLVSVFSEFGFSGKPFVQEEFIKPSQVFQIGRPPNRIDVLTSIDGVDWQEVWEGKVQGSLGGVLVQFISKESLIKNKLSTGRLQDKADVESLR